MHKNDIYGDLDVKGTRGAIPAATVILLHDTLDGFQVLMLRKSSKIAFGGMWVFPGGRIDPEDYPESGDLQSAARNAASREALEEAAVQVRPKELVWFAHWSPPPSTRKRFATWFFAGRGDRSAAVEVDGGEILEHAWIAPEEALAKHRAGEVDLAPPTWVTLYHLSRYSAADPLLEHLASRRPGVYETHVVQRSDGVRVALWRGDAGYEAWDADLPGDRHRLVMAKAGFEFDHSAVDY